MSTDELYDLFIKGDKNFKEAIEDGEAHGVITPEDRKSLNKFRKRWFKVVNKLMLKKIKYEQ
jgi:hypothetical protein